MTLTPSKPRSITPSAQRGTNTEKSESYLNKNVFFPAGIYKVSAPLILSHVWSPTLIGAGSRQTRIVYIGGEVTLEDFYLGEYSALLVCNTCWHVHIEGMTLDAGGVQIIAMASLTHESGGGNGAGHDGYYRDVISPTRTLMGFFLT